MTFKANKWNQGYDCYRCAKNPDLDDVIDHRMGCFAGVFKPVDWLCPDCGRHCIRAYDHRFECGSTQPVTHIDGTRGLWWGIHTDDLLIVTWLNHSKKSPLTPIWKLKNYE